ncbi:hypothetical protein LB557_05025 [Mesorhizobium sp. BR115XR7A]|uniref:hypothetical protein n=1 Tax=Mesorhizobium sp. BR115XR7A TaxID=2876645 RepID=UPI001CCB3BF1|nr:hypothetical protein [Mesorhizobium sp. BR115XR7A]MBZ9905369.1 hypothetical protein [Mesorhizobium sp. BR115XR7A]MBZ9929560.1 hypothetical protein [Mesorhizobium sp. BR1-1-5]
MLVKVECSCGNVRYCRSADLMMVYGGGADPLKLKFDCNRCKPSVKITLLELAAIGVAAQIEWAKGVSKPPSQFVSIANVNT